MSTYCELARVPDQPLHITATKKETTTPAFKGLRHGNISCTTWFFFLHLKNREYSLIEKFLFITKAGIRVWVKQRVINILVKTAVELFHLLIMPPLKNCFKKPYISFQTCYYSTELTLNRITRLTIINCHCDSIIDFLANSYFIVQIYHAQSFKMKYICISIFYWDIHKYI